MKQHSSEIPLQLAPTINESTPTSISHSEKRIVIVGANGAGKSRFASYMAEHNQSAYRISALQGLFNQSYRDNSPGSIDSQYAELFNSPLQVPAAPTTQADRVTALLLRHEMVILLSHKLNGGKGGCETSSEQTPLDKVISLWQDIFPNNQILVEAGNLLIKSKTANDHYSTLGMSAGERAILFLLGAVVLAPKEAKLFIDTPEIFLHPSITQSVWNRIELLRSDCQFIYITHDLDFAGSRTGAPIVWVRQYDPQKTLWDYQIIPGGTAITEDVYATILGARKPVLFIEGDGVHSIDAKFYPLIFTEFTIKSLGSCNKVIEATRTFNDLSAFHHTDSYGIVDRDRRDEVEVSYLRRKKVMVPDVAEIENILLLEEVVKAVASYCRRNPGKVFNRVKSSIIKQFRHDLNSQALMHTRHSVKRIMTYRIDGRFTSINMLEEHLRSLPDEVNARGLYEDYCRKFHAYVANEDYHSVLSVYNNKSMLPACNIAGLCGLTDKKEYINTILHILSHEAPEAEAIRTAVKNCFGLQEMVNTEVTK